MQEAHPMVQIFHLGLIKYTRMKKALIIVSILLFVVLASLFYVIVHSDAKDDIIKEKNIRHKITFDLDAHLNQNPLNTGNLIDSFPYTVYLDSANFLSIRTIKKDLAGLGLYTQNPDLNSDVFISLLTTQLRPRYNHYFEGYKPDSLLQLLQWVEKFHGYAEIDPENDIVFRSVFNYWMDAISHQLNEYSNVDPSRVYDFKFKYLRARLMEKKFSPSFKKTKWDKAVENLIYNKWGHLVEASWNQTSLIQKLLFFFIIAITLAGYVCLFFFCLKFIKKSKK